MTELDDEGAGGGTRLSRRAVFRLAASAGVVAAGIAGAVVIRDDGESSEIGSGSQIAGRDLGADPDSGITIYVVDRGNNCIRAISPDGAVRTVAGSSYGYQDGPAASARFAVPFGVAVSPSGALVVADQGNDRIREISVAGEVSTLAGSAYGFADGGATTARFRQPYGLTVAPDGRVFVADTINHRVRVIDVAGGVTTVAGSEPGHRDGAVADARFDEPSDVAVDSDGTIYVADRANHRIRAITPDGAVRTVAGGEEGGDVDGRVDVATFNRPTAIDIAADGTLFIADIINNRIRALSPDGVVSTVAGSAEGALDGPGFEASFRHPCGVAVAPSGRLYVADRENHRIRAVGTDGTVTTLAGAAEGFADGTGVDARFSYPYALAISVA